MLKSAFIGMVLGMWVFAYACLAQAYEVIEVKDGGVISGTVKLTGEEAPAPEQINVDKDPEVCGKHMPKLSEKIIVDKATKGVKNAVVYLIGVAKGKAFTSLASEPAEPHSHGGAGEVPTSSPGESFLDQKECSFVPHVQVIPAGGAVELRNGDPLMHNLHSFSMKNSSFNESIPGDGKPVHKKFDYPEVVKVGCDVHKWMSAWIVVRDNPYYAVTGDDGSFKITDIPPGTYKLNIWHEAASKEDLKKLTKDVNVETTKEVKADFEVALK